MKQFIQKILLYSIPIIVPVVIFSVFVNPNLHGDIGPLGYVTFADAYAKVELLNDNKVVNSSYALKKIDENSVLTIGDSFSQTNINKGEVSYNYYLANYTDLKVYNLNQQWNINPFARFLYMSKTMTLPRIVIIESVERYFIENLLSIEISLSVEDMLIYNMVDTIVDYKSQPKSILEKTQEWVKRELCINGYDNPVKFALLNHSYFSCENRESELYFYVDDIRHVELTDSMAKIVIEKLDNLYRYTESLGVQLYILIAADKYNVYQDFIVNNPYPHKNILDKLFSMYDNQCVINSKDTLSNMVANYVQDVYWCNNTHWSPVGSEAVAIQVAKVINQTQGKEIFKVN